MYIRANDNSWSVSVAFNNDWQWSNNWKTFIQQFFPDKMPVTDIEIHGYRNVLTKIINNLPVSLVFYSSIIGKEYQVLLIIIWLCGCVVVWQINTKII